MSYLSKVSPKLSLSHSLIPSFLHSFTRSLNHSPMLIPHLLPHALTHWVNNGNNGLLVAVLNQNVCCTSHHISLSSNLMNRLLRLVTYSQCQSMNYTGVYSVHQFAMYPPVVRAFLYLFHLFRKNNETQLKLWKSWKNYEAQQKEVLCCAISSSIGGRTLGLHVTGLLATSQ